MDVNNTYRKVLYEVYESIDIPESRINKYLDVLSLNIILKSLSADDRKHFYRLMENGDDYAVSDFVYKRIPDFQSLLKSRIQEFIKGIHV